MWTSITHRNLHTWAKHQLCMPLLYSHTVTVSLRPHLVFLPDLSCLGVHQHLCCTFMHHSSLQHHNASSESVIFGFGSKLSYSLKHICHAITVYELGVSCWLREARELGSLSSAAAQQSTRDASSLIISNSTFSHSRRRRKTQTQRGRRRRLQPTSRQVHPACLPQQSPASSSRLLCLYQPASHK